MDAVVNTRYCKVRGSRAAGIYSFKGIPFAAPPFGANRLLPPQPVEPWSGVRDALDYGPKCPQPAYPPEIALLLPPEVGGTGEDCLTLNIWSADLGPARRPVMVWIPGGMYAYHATGASPWYDGGRFARDGVVCVSTNYRVAIDGFLYLGEGNANRGLLDQVAALEWVRDNIAAFGGDPENVTIFGESAGALSISTLLAMPRAEVLFRRAIVQSGSAHHVMPLATAQRVRERVAEKLGAEVTRDALAAIGVDRLLAAQTELEADLAAHPDPERWGAEVVASSMPWQPTIDGEVLPGPPIERIAAGAGAGVDLIVGTNVDETRLFLVPTGAIDFIRPEVLAGAVMAYGLPADAALHFYRAAHPGASAGDLLSAVQTDWYWRIPAMRLADAHASAADTHASAADTHASAADTHASAADAHAQGAAPTYMYEFAWPSPQYDGRLGACHALEIPFVFDTVGNGTDLLWGPDPPQRLADAMHAAWVAFAANGDPGWPRYDPNLRATMRFDVAPEVVNDPLSAERALWGGVR